MWKPLETVKRALRVTCGTVGKLHRAGGGYSLAMTQQRKISLGKILPLRFSFLGEAAT